MTKGAIKKDNKLKAIVKSAAAAGYIIATVLLIAVAALTALSTLGWPAEYRILVVQSGSMEPAVLTGSIVVVQPRSDYQVDDVITFTSHSDQNVMVTHRVVDMENTAHGAQYTTKGDANEAVDARPVSRESIIGKVIFSVPYIGYPVAFAKTQIGFILLIVIPAALIIFSELAVIKNEVKKILRKRKKHRTVRVSVKREESGKVLDLRDKQ